MKIFMTGGHLTPALAVIDEIKAHHPQDEIYFLGRRFSQSALKQLAVEELEVTKRGVTFINFGAPRIGQLSFGQLITWPVVFGISLLQAVGLIIRHRPQVFLSFGSYLAVPVALGCFLCRVPIVTHEGTKAIGWATKFIARLAKVTAVADSATLKFLPPHLKIKVVGIPLRASILAEQVTRPDWFKSDLQRPMLMVLGGNQGALVINQLLKSMLPTLLPKWTIVHQCGRPNRLANYHQELLAAVSQLSVACQQNYYPLPWINDQDLAWLYRQTTVALARSGANTVAELTVNQVPSILIPLPYAHFQEQAQNAQAMSQLGGAIIISEAELSAANLLASLEKVTSERQKMVMALAENQLPKDSAAQLYQLLINVSH